jgi:hypothetical protein
LGQAGRKGEQSNEREGELEEQSASGAIVRDGHGGGDWGSLKASDFGGCALTSDRVRVI